MLKLNDSTQSNSTPKEYTYCDSHTYRYRILIIHLSQPDLFWWDDLWWVNYFHGSFHASQHYGWLIMLNGAGSHRIKKWDSYYNIFVNGGERGVGIRHSIKSDHTGGGCSCICVWSLLNDHRLRNQTDPEQPIWVLTDW